MNCSFKQGLGACFTGSFIGVLIVGQFHKPYLEAVEQSFGADIDYPMLVKVYGNADAPAGHQSPAPCVGAKKERVEGKPDPKQISTSFVERANLSMRLGNRRLTRLTNGFSKKAENHAHAMAIYFMHYNFVRVHQTLRCTPAMAAGVQRSYGSWQTWLRC